MIGSGSVGAIRDSAYKCRVLPDFVLVFLAPYGPMVGPTQFLAVFWLSAVGQLALMRANGGN